MHTSDCGLAALAMALGVPYERVFQAAPLAAREGLTARQLQAVATKLGARLRSKRDVDLYADTGILGIEFSRGPGHWCYLHAGTLVDPDDTTLWDVDDYLAHFDAVWDGFYVAEASLQRRPLKRRRKA